MQHDAGYIYKRDMDYVPSYVAACAGHESFRSIDSASVDSMSRDSDYDSGETFENVSSVSYSAYDGEGGDLEMDEYIPFHYYNDPERHLEDETNVDLETALQIYRDILSTYYSD